MTTQSRVVFPLVLMLTLIAGTAAAGEPELTIYLKGGAGTIRAERIWEQADQVCWESRGYQGCVPTSSVSFAPRALNGQSRASAPGPNSNALPVVALDPDEFCGNPFQHKGRDVVLRGLRFRRVIGNRSATFGTPGDREIEISGLPTDRSLTPGEWYDFLVRPLGVSTGTNAYGGAVTTPHALYVGLP